MSSLYELQKFIMKRKTTLSLTGADLETYESILFNAIAVEDEEFKRHQHKLELDFIPSAKVRSELINDGFTFQDNFVFWNSFLTTAHT